MRRLLLIPLVFLPLSAGAAIYPTASSTPSNTYTAASEVTIEKPLPADLITAGATVNITAPVNGDVLAAGGTLMVAEGAGGDVRVAGGRVRVFGTVGGDIAAAGGSVEINGAARNMYAAGGSVGVSGSSEGDVTIYGANVTLTGDYAGNVSVVASNHFTLGENTHIGGNLKYSAPEQLVIPATTVIDGTASYTGAYAYVPTNQQAHQYAILGLGIFFAVRMLAGMIVAGLIVGLFPLFSERIASMAVSRRPSSVFKLFGIGIAIAILIPILSIFLLISFVGAELALLLVLLYALLAIVAYVFCSIVVGLLIRRTLLYRINGVLELSWGDAVLGTAVLQIIGLIPFIGAIAIFILTLICVGALLVVLYRELFDHTSAYL